ncbi:MAG: GGDEF domain-containing protein [Xanthomonadales bacterium]|jgi:diguanylate cyclase (GGDEF)-like protein|nr:GGDEF domain-containing protein [Xanthomonadales bacterium]MBN8794517.1 GGDEF domain-containing protein [Stenotrophomonas nitritireducens]
MEPLADGVYQTLLIDLVLAAVLLALFAYAGRLSRGVRGVTAWGAMYFLYTLGTAMLDVIGPLLVHGGHPRFAAQVINAGVLLACMALVGLAWAVIGFVQQRPLRLWERAFLPVAALASLVAWLGWNSRDAQTVALTAVELAAFALMIHHLLALRQPPERLPARLMLACCAGLALLYGSVLPGWWQGRFGFSDSWVNVDVSLWFLLNFCMLMLASFRAAEGLRRSAMTDPLTGALNRRGIEDALLLARDQRQAAPDAAIHFDIDHFKSINDRHGHAIGDETLRRLAEVVRVQLRVDDLFERFGGDEFTILLRGDTGRAAPEVARRIHAAVKAQALHAVAAPGEVTISIGVHVEPGASVEALMRGADAALYRAKQQGRDRIVAFPDAPAG